MCVKTRVRASSTTNGRPIPLLLESGINTWPTQLVVPLRSQRNQNGIKAESQAWSAYHASHVFPAVRSHVEEKEIRKSEVQSVCVGVRSSTRKSLPIPLSHAPSNPKFWAKRARPRRRSPHHEPHPGCQFAAAMFCVPLFTMYWQRVIFPNSIGGSCPREALRNTGRSA